MKERALWTCVAVVQAITATIFWLTWEISHETFPLIAAISMTVACICAMVVAVCS